MPTCCAATEALMRRVRGEYWEMPGLKLTMPQAQRLWALDAATCQSLLHSLVENGFLARTPDGSYARLESY
jgi:Fic family protein